MNNRFYYWVVFANNLRSCCCCCRLFSYTFDLLAQTSFPPDHIIKITSIHDVLQRASSIILYRIIIHFEHIHFILFETRPYCHAGYHTNQSCTILNFSACNRPVFIIIKINHIIRFLEHNTTTYGAAFYLPPQMIVLKKKYYSLLYFKNKFKIFKVKFMYRRAATPHYKPYFLHYSWKVSVLLHLLTHTTTTTTII